MKKLLPILLLATTLQLSAQWPPTPGCFPCCTCGCDGACNDDCGRKGMVRKTLQKLHLLKARHMHCPRKGPIPE